MKETEIGARVITWLQEYYPSWEIYQEIRPGKYSGGRIADIVCTLNDVVWVIELKKTLNLEVIRQAYEWRVDKVSVAFIAPKRHSETHRWWKWYLRHRMGIGTIAIDPHNTHRIRETISMSERPEGINQGLKDRFLELCQSGKTDGMAEAGSKDGGYWTPYKETIKMVKEYIHAHPGCGIGDIVGALGKMHYASAHSARTNLPKNLRSLEQDWCRVERKGTYDIFFVREDV